MIDFDTAVKQTAGLSKAQQPNPGLKTPVDKFRVSLIGPDGNEYISGILQGNMKSQIDHLWQLQKLGDTPYELFAEDGSTILIPPSWLKASAVHITPVTTDEPAQITVSLVPNWTKIPTKDKKE